MNTIFAVVETILLRPLNFPQSNRMLVVSQSNLALGSGPSVVTLQEFQRWQQSGLFERAAATDTKGYTLLGPERAERPFGVRVTPDFFQVLGLRPHVTGGTIAVWNDGKSIEIRDRFCDWTANGPHLAHKFLG